MNPQTWKGRAITAWVIAIAVFVAVFLMGAFRNDDGSGPPGSDPPAHCLPGDREVLPCDVIPDEALCESNVFNKNSLPSTDKATSDSLSTPHVSDIPQEMFVEDREDICGNPTLFKGWIDLFENVPAVWGSNPWMAAAKAKAEERGLDPAFLSADGVHMTPQFTRWAQMLNTVLLDYKPLDEVMPWMTWKNWHLPLGSTTAGASPMAVENQDQEDLPSLILIYTEKDDECPDPEDPGAVIGSNDIDKRPELFLPRCLPPEEEPPCTSCPPDTPPTTEGLKANTGTTIAATPATVVPTSTTSTTLPPGQTGGGDSGSGAPTPSSTPEQPTPTSEPPVTLAS